MPTKSFAKARLFVLFSFLLLGAATVVAVIAQQAQQAVQLRTEVRAEVRVLEPSMAIERELVGGQSHSYQIRLAAGEYLQVAVEQRGISVGAGLFDSDNKKLIEADSPNGIREPKLLTWITERSGIYRLEIRSLKKEAEVGRYEVKIVELRSATEADQALVEARNLSTQAISLTRIGKYAELFHYKNAPLCFERKYLGLTIQMLRTRSICLQWNSLVKVTKYEPRHSSNVNWRFGRKRLFPIIHLSSIHL